jgi:hypothetical protein
MKTQAQRLTADKREIEDFPKLPYFDWTQYKSTTSFMLETIAKMALRLNAVIEEQR